MVRIYPVFEHYVPAVKIDGVIVPVVVEHTRRWEDRAALAAALERRGYVEQAPDEFHHRATPAARRGRPVTDTLEQQAAKRRR